MNKVDPDPSKAKEMEERVASRTHEIDEASRKLDRAQAGFSALSAINPVPTALTRQLNVDLSPPRRHGKNSARTILSTVSDQGQGFDVKSQPGQGATAIIKIPLEQMDS